jgi:hypothetical protein
LPALGAERHQFDEECADVDGQRLGVWGTSYSGGQVLAVAAWYALRDLMRSDDEEPL